MWKFPRRAPGEQQGSKWNEELTDQMVNQVHKRLCQSTYKTDYMGIPQGNAPVICITGSLGAGDSGDIAGPKCRDLTFDESRQCRRCAGVLISRQNANLCHILTTKGQLSLYICTV